MENIMEKYPIKFIKDKVNLFERIIKQNNEKYDDTGCTVIELDTYEHREFYEIYGIKPSKYGGSLVCEGNYYTDERVYTYDTTNPYDEGWGIEKGEFIIKQERNVPTWLFDVSEKELVNRVAKIYSKAYKRYIKWELESKQQKILELQDEIKELQSKN